MLPADRLVAIAERARREHGVPGLAVGAVVNGELAWFAGLGWADIQTGGAPHERSLSRVASVTKSFTATAILQLRDRGLLSLSDPLARHVPEFAAVRERGGRRDDVTIRAILTHRSGLVTESPPTAWDVPSFPTMPEILAALPDTEVAVPADTEWKYSNLGFGLLGEVISRLSGEPYEAYMTGHLFRPLGMTDTAFTQDARLASLAMTGYLPGINEDRPRVAPTTPLAGLVAAGQLQTTVADLARWIAFQTGALPGRDAILSPSTLAEAHEVRYVQPDWQLGQALAFRIVRRGERLFHNHGGSVHGFNSSVAFHLPTRTGVVVLANLWPATIATPLAMDLLDVVVDSVAEPVAPAAVQPSVPDAIRPLLGRYWAEPGVDGIVEWRAGGLWLLAPPNGYSLLSPVQLLPVEGQARSFRLAHGRGAGETATFADDGGGGLSFSIGGFTFRR